MYLRKRARSTTPNFSMPTAKVSGSFATALATTVPPSLPAGDANALRIAEAGINEILYASCDVVDLAAAGVFNVGIAKAFAVSGAATEIRLQDDVTLVCQVERRRRSGQWVSVPSGPPCARMTVGYRLPG